MDQDRVPGIAANNRSARQGSHGELGGKERQGPFSLPREREYKFPMDDVKGLALSSELPTRPYVCCASSYRFSHMKLFLAISDFWDTAQWS